MRFHQALSFLTLDSLAPIAVSSDELGYAGVYLSDHLFNPESLNSRYTYSEHPDGTPGWEKDMAWPDPMCTISALSAITKTLTFTTGVYIAPVRDLMTVAKTVGTTAVLSRNRVNLGVGVGWCEEEFLQTGQEFSNRGKRLDEMIPALRSLFGGGWVEHHGTYYDVPKCQIHPSPTQPVPIFIGGHSAPALRRAAALGDGWIAAGAYSEDEAWGHLEALNLARQKAGTEDLPFRIFMSLGVRPNVTLFRRFEDAGVTDFVCAPWMFIPPTGTAKETLEKRLGACRWFADEFVQAMPDRS